MKPEERVFDHICRTYGDKMVLPVGDLEASLAGENQHQDRSVLIAFLKSWSGKGLGMFYAGRRGQPTRMAWSRPPKDVSPDAVITGANPASAANGSAPRTLTIEVPVRPGVVATLAVPEDLSPLEAERLADFIKRLPVGGTKAA